jgi:hypothetical protein
MDRDILLQLYRHYDDMERYAFMLGNRFADYDEGEDAELFYLLSDLFRYSFGNDRETKKRLEAFRKKLIELNERRFDRILKMLDKESEDIIKNEVLFLLLFYLEFFSVDLKKLTKDEMKQIYLYGFFYGLTRVQIFERVMNRSVNDIYEIVSSGMLNHIPMEELVNNVKKALEKTSENIITETNGIVDGLINDAALAVAEKNNMLLKYCDMMDSRVCGKCMKYRNKTFRYDSKDIPLIPQHPHCRCHWMLIPDDGKTYKFKDDVKFSDYYQTLSEKEKKIRVGQSKYFGEKSGVYKLKDYETPVLGSGLSLSEVSDRDKKMLTITG